MKNFKTYYSLEAPEFQAISCQKSWLIDFLSSDFFTFYNENSGKYNMVDDNNHVNIYDKNNKFYSTEPWETRKDFKKRTGIDFITLLRKANYIEFINPHDIQIWSKNKELLEYNGWIEKNI